MKQLKVLVAQTFPSFLLILHVSLCKDWEPGCFTNLLNL